MVDTSTSMRRFLALLVSLLAVTAAGALAGCVQEDEEPVVDDGAGPIDDDGEEPQAAELAWEESFTISEEADGASLSLMVRPAEEGADGTFVACVLGPEGDVQGRQTGALGGATVAEPAVVNFTFSADADATANGDENLTAGNATQFPDENQCLGAEGSDVQAGGDAAMEENVTVPLVAGNWTFQVWAEVPVLVSAEFMETTPEATDEEA